ncbi:leucine-rich repeat domain-containing protein [Salmonirosea aquatica]|uniref:Leucine-rich repeat domain-containing protein n=1 Tax=Salmonirosea aquatica TaxID=2654236 RepID=A0A7C9BJ36_9BACT|nr:leucine-rich repeat domain-containing protein [Cytophagaceae bacterium SJW1-29]
MKTLLLLVSLLTFGPLLYAQPKVLSHEGLKHEGITEDQLATAYTSTNGIAGAIQIGQNLDTLIRKALSKTTLTNYLLTYGVYVNESGSIDYVLYDLARVKEGRDSLQNLIESALPPLLQDWQLKGLGGKKVRFYRILAMGRPPQPRTVRTGDSLISTLEAARTTLDTLKIKSLHLHQLDLTEVPYDAIYRFPNLEVLDLHQNKLTALDLDMARLPRLKNLDLRENMLSQETLKLTVNRSLKILNVHTNRLTDVPDAARNCKELESLWMGGNKELKFSNRSFRKLRSLHDLNLYGCELTSLPGGIRKLRGLEVLDLYYNTFAELPKPVTRLRKLNQLAVAHNQITTLPKRIDRLKHLQMFYIHHNHLSTLPDRMPRLEKLQLLDLGYNWFSTLPPEILALQNLRELDLSGNNLNTFPVQLSEARYLEKLHLRGNPFLRNETEQAYLPYIQQLEKKPTEVFY